MSINGRMARVSILKPELMYDAGADGYDVIHRLCT